MELQKRECGINIKLVADGSEWMKIFIDNGENRLCFIVSNADGDPFDDLLRALYNLHPDNLDPENANDIVQYKIGVCDIIESRLEVIQIVDNIDEIGDPYITEDIPWKAQFTWKEKGADCALTIERSRTEINDFMVKIHIERMGTDKEIYDFLVRYKDFCYAIAKASTEVLKEYGLFGFFCANNFHDLNLRHLLFLKSVALDNDDAYDRSPHKCASYDETTDLNKELELLLFDM